MKWRENLLRDPIRLGWFGRGLWLLLIVANAIGSYFDGLLAGLLVAASWAGVPVIGIAVGMSQAFFLQYGRGRVLVALQLALGIIVALAVCVVLAQLSAGEARKWVTTGLEVLLFVGLSAAVVGAVSLAIARGEAYVSGRIGKMSEEDW